MKVLIKRFKSALHTNEPQITAVLLFTCLNFLAIVKREDAPVWGYIFALLFWPVVAFIFNLISPIPTDKD